MIAVTQLWLCQVLPKHNEISSDCDTRYVRIVGTQEAVFRVRQYNAYNRIMSLHHDNSVNLFV